MLFPEEDAPLLKTWIVKRIENTSDADSDVLADYVIALLKHDGDVQSVRKLCEAEIPDFLTEEPKAFLDDVFQAITYKSYRPGAPPAPVPKPIAQSAAAATAAELTNLPQPGSRKRGFQNHAEFDGQEEQDALYGGGRGNKQPRRGARHVTGGRQGGYPPVGSLPGLPGLPPFDPNNPMEAIMQMQTMGIPYPGIPDFPAQAYLPSWRNQPRRRGRCRDFDTKGYCARGNTCMYDHGNDSIYVPPVSAQGEEYDPSNAVIAASQQPAFSSDMSRGRGGRRGRGGKKGGARAPFSAEGPVHDRTKSTIVVENIPEENFSEDDVRGFFSQFGNMVEVSMQPYKHLAIVKYEKWASANAAYRSPKVIFDNRFVKVFWYKDEEDVVPRSMPSNGANAPKSNDGLGDSEPGPDAIDLEEFQRRQEEAQKQHQEREAKKTELERQRQELEKQQQELLAKHREESERLKAKLAGKNGSDAAKGQGSSATDVLRAQLAALEQEAKILGIDPNGADDGSSTYSSRGGGFRGRGGRGGRGAFSVRGRGSFRGQAGRHTAYAQYSIDNRPKKLAVSGVDFTPADKDEMLRHFLLNLGEFESVETSPSVTHVAFQDRKTAERFYYMLHGKELPGVTGTLDLSWVNNAPLPPAGAKTTTTTTASSEDRSAAAATGDAMAGMDDAHEAALRNEDAMQQRDERQVDMDYEVAGEDGWVE